MSLTVTRRPDKPVTSYGVQNGALTGKLYPWDNVGSGTAWTYSANKATITLTDPTLSKKLIQAFTVGEDISYSYSFDIVVSSIGADDYKLNFVTCDASGNLFVYIVQVDLADGSQTVSGTLTINPNDSNSYIAFYVDLGGGP